MNVIYLWLGHKYVTPLKSSRDMITHIHNVDLSSTVWWSLYQISVAYMLKVKSPLSK